MPLDVFAYHMVRPHPTLVERIARRGGSDPRNNFHPLSVNGFFFFFNLFILSILLLFCGFYFNHCLGMYIVRLLRPNKIKNKRFVYTCEM